MRTARKPVHECAGTGCLCTECQKDREDCCSRKPHRRKGCPIHECADFVAEAVYGKE